MGDYLAGIDIGGTKTAVILARQSERAAPPEILERIAFSTPVGAEAKRGPIQIQEALREALERRKLSPSDLAAIGASCGGPLDSENGLILSPPNLYGWDELPIVRGLEEAFGVPSALQNDADACALAEWRYGAGQGCRNMIFLTMGTGMGAGLILNGRLYSGTNGMGGEVGHTRLDRNGPVGYGKEGSFEGFCSGGGIAQVARTRALELLQTGKPASYCATLEELPNITARSVAEAAQAGHSDALAVWRETGERLGQGVSLLIDILNPERIVIGSIFQRSETLLRESMELVIARETLSRNRSVCEIVPALLGDQIGDYAALSVARYRLDNA
ncbi:MAG: ROK family protein [Oscillospiraceae bacterium]